VGTAGAAGVEHPIYTGVFGPGRLRGWLLVDRTDARV